MGGLNLFLSLVSILLAISFYVAVERKLLGLLQWRHGPNKAGFCGLVLPLLDGVKLISKEVLRPSVSEVWLFISGPSMIFFVSFAAWLLYPVSSSSMHFEHGVLYYMCLICVNVFGLVLCGWGSGCQYGLLGGMRAAAQSISYELGLITVLFCVLVFMGTYDFYQMRSGGFFCLLFSLEVCLMWVVSFLAELNRIPFDFVEGESELVSGYMVEYGGILFVLIILSEYGSVIFTSVLTVVLFLSALPAVSILSDGGFVLMAVVLSLVIISLRGSLPRYRYDKLMGFCWKLLLPMSTGFLLLSLVSV